MVRDVQTRPEWYLNITATSCIGLLAFGLFWGGLSVHRSLGSVPLGMAFQIIPWLSTTVSMYTPRLAPEPALVLAGMGISTILIMGLRDDPHSCGAKAAMGMGLWVGFGAASKITFLPMALAPLIVLRGIRARTLFGAISIVSFAGWTLPVWGRYAYFAQWIGNLLTHSGRYGHGPSGLIDRANYGGDLVHLLANEPLLVVGLLGGCVFWTFWLCR